MHRQKTHNIIRRFYRQSVPIICVSEAIQNQLMQDGGDPSKLYLIYNGMDTGKVHHGPNPLSKKYRGKTLILGVGNLKYTKGFDLFIRAFARLTQAYQNLQGVIVGDGQAREKLQALISQLGVADALKLIGAKPPVATMAYMAMCDIFCLPSWSEGFGIVYLEAMAHGKPIIAVEGQGISQIISRHKTGILVPPKNELAVTKALQCLLNRPTLRFEMGQRGRALVHHEFTWKHCALNHIKLYKKLLSKAQTPRYNVSIQN